LAIATVAVQNPFLAQPQKEEIVTMSATLEQLVAQAEQAPDAPPAPPAKVKAPPKPQGPAPFRYVAVTFVIQNTPGFDPEKFASDLQNFASEEHSGIMLSDVAVADAVLQKKRTPRG
jgi:hypothetical protein